MDELVAWLGRQLDEDTRQASSWHALECDIHAYLQGDLDSVKAAMAMFHDAPGAVCDCGIPARVLREIGAKRQLVEGHEPDERVPPRCTGCFDGCPCRHLRLLAAPYADRPGYREEWRP
ncbi:DUF6221 family protein [Streptomyces sp. NPDC050085]|uniref:DUF6221 family protein n=1 Tax=Streptomyces sp. NPDC050085 TaxID=3365600 RepID=UPI00378CFB24